MESVYYCSAPSETKAKHKGSFFSMQSFLRRDSGSRRSSLDNDDEEFTLLVCEHAGMAPSVLMRVQKALSSSRRVNDASEA
jgi:hypothetical protein